MAERLPDGTVVAGVDIGNSTTEIAIGVLGRGATTVVAFGRHATAGAKGSRQSLEGAAKLLALVESEHDIHADIAVLAHLAPAPVVSASWPQPPPDHGLPLRLIAVADGGTSAGDGVFAGLYVQLESVVGISSEPMVVGVGRQWDFEDAAAALRSATAQGAQITGVLVERDEAVLIANRLDFRIPIVDTVDLTGIAAGVRVVGEVARGGRALRRLPDPVFLTWSLGLGSAEVARMAPVSSYLACRSLGVVAASTVDAGKAADPVGELCWEHQGECGRLALPTSAESLARAVVPGTVTGIVAVPGTALATALEACPAGVLDLAALDVPGAREVPLALLAGGAETTTPVAEMAALLGRPVLAGGSEAHAAFAGATTTPGLPAENLIVVDIGAGTLDVITSESSVVVAGAGELVTAGVAAALAISRGLAEQAKIHPAMRVETPNLVAREDGVRVFLDDPAPGSLVGRLSLVGSSGELVGLGARTSPEEWRRLRREIKATVLHRGLARAERLFHSNQLGGGGSPLVLLAGGGAEDQELVAAAAGFTRLGQVATADVAGRFGARYAVAWGLVLTASTVMGEATTAETSGGTS